MPVETLQHLRLISAVLTVSTAYVSIVFLRGMPVIYLAGLSTALILLVPTLWLHDRVRKARLLLDLHESWGKLVGRERKQTVTQAHYALGDTNSSKLLGSFRISDRTWQDLDMDAVFAHLDRTFTTPGEQMLYTILHTPALEPAPLLDREKLIEHFLTNEPSRLNVQGELFRISHNGGYGIVDLLWKEPPQRPTWAFVPSLLYLLALVAPLTFILGPSVGMLVLFTIFGINALMHYALQRRVASFMLSIGYLGRLVSVAHRLAQAGNNELPQKYRTELAKHLHGPRRLIKATKMAAVLQNDDFIYTYANIYLMVQVRAFYKSLQLVRTYQSDLQALYELLGFIDAMQAVASFRDGNHNSFCVPDLNTTTCSIEISQASHPLLEHTVPNSFSADQNIVGAGGTIITGSNMSGKSTYLRTVGVNILLAQTIHTCLAESYMGGLVRLFTAIGNSDNLISGKSYYLTEAETIHKMVLTAAEQPSAFCIIDEMFRGTNAPERIAAVVEVLRYLARWKCFVLVATHDLEVPRILHQQYRNFHFCEDVGAMGLSFDYTLKAGVATQRNAIKLLRHIGYPSEIVDNAAEIAELLVTEGVTTLIKE